MDTIEQIVKHPAVSRVYANGAKIETLTADSGLQALCRLRRMRGEAKRAIANALEEFAAMGRTDSPARMPLHARELEQLRIARSNAAALPSDLVALLNELAGFVA